MILGIGLDIVEIARFERELAQSGDGLLEELFTAAEISYCRGMRRPHPYYAARFAAREALFKALGTGRVGGMRWRDVEVVREESGRPLLAMEGETARTAAALGVVRVHLSLAHTERVAAATVVLEG